MGEAVTESLGPGAEVPVSAGDESVDVEVSVGVGLGLWVDDLAHTGPAFLLVGLALGVAAAAMSIVKQVRTYL